MANINGTAGRDRIIDTPGDDLIRALSGNDNILAFAGNDTIRLGNGDDLVFAFTGNDTIQGGSGTDGILGGSGNDSLGASPQGLPSGTGIFFNDGATPELIGIVADVLFDDLNLDDANQFSFV